MTDRTSPVYAVPSVTGFGLWYNDSGFQCNGIMTTILNASLIRLMTALIPRLMTALIPVKRVRVRVRRRHLACLPTPWVKELWENP